MKPVIYVDIDGVLLANELHGPEDVMHISRDQVTFWENMKDDPQVVLAINEYQSR